MPLGRIVLLLILTLFLQFDGLLLWLWAGDSAGILIAVGMPVICVYLIRREILKGPPQDDGRTWLERYWQSKQYPDADLFATLLVAAFVVAFLIVRSLEDGLGGIVWLLPIVVASYALMAFAVLRRRFSKPEHPGAGDKASTAESDDEFNPS